MNNILVGIADSLFETFLELHKNFTQFISKRKYKNSFFNFFT